LSDTQLVYVALSFFVSHLSFRPAASLTFSLDDTRLVNTSEQAKPARRRWFTWFCALAPLIALLFFITMSLHVRVSFGKWPEHAVHHFSSVSLQVHQLVFVLSMFFAMFGAIPLWLLFLCFRSLRLKLPEHLLQVVSFVVGWSIHYFLYASPGGEWMTWCYD